MQITHTKRIKKKLYIKDEKNVNMDKNLTLNRSVTIRSRTFIFHVQPKLLLYDLVKKGFLKPLDRKLEDDNMFMGNLYAYCTYHQRKGHATNSCKYLKATILDLIAQRKYEIKENTSNPNQVVNTISMNDDICATLMRDCLKLIPNLVITKQLSLPPDPKAYSMIE